MQRLAVLCSLLASACIGTITEGEPNPPDPDPQPEPQPVTDVSVRVRDGATPQANVKVIFQAADDTVIADATTDATGTATAKMPAGGNLTVIRTFGPNVYGEPGPIDHVYTYVGVKPGDKLELVGAERDDTTRTTKITVGLEPGASVAVVTPCGTANGIAPTIDVQLKGCGAETDFLVIDQTGDPEQGGLPLYFTAHAKITPEIDFSTETFRGTLTTEMTAANAQLTVVLQKRLVLGNFVVFDSGQIPAYTPTVATDVPELPNTQQLVSAWVYENERTYVVSSRDYFSATPATVDIAARMVPQSVAPALAGDTLTWTERGAGTPDLAVVSLTVGAVDRQFVRRIAAPYGGASLRIPALPAAHDRYNVLATDTPRIVHHLASATGGYDRVRAHVFDHELADIAPMGGTAGASWPATTEPR